MIPQDVETTSINMVKRSIILTVSRRSPKVGLNLHYPELPLNEDADPLTAAGIVTAPHLARTEIPSR